jgi:pantoate--beta-alanine ligase
VESINDPKAMALWSASQRRSVATLGFVPTMGALHEGHLALVERSRNQCDRTICSIFVNPLQFNDPKDLEHYPRRLDEDRKLLENLGCDALFIPEADQLFQHFKACNYDLGGLDDHWDGPSRPGHFQGVVNVVERLFHYTRPDKAFFGEKDRQQLSIIQYVTKQQRWPIDIIGCPTLREPNGLAMSSRNLRLTPEEREKASILWKSLKLAEQLAPNSSIPEINDQVQSTMATEPAVRLDHFGLADISTLQPLNELTDEQSAIAFISAWVGPVRLIDNLVIRRTKAHPIEYP